MSNPTVVIAGAGLAGATVATELRERGFGGRILLLGLEEHRDDELVTVECPPVVRASIGERQPAGTR